MIPPGVLSCYRSIARRRIPRFIVGIPVGLWLLSVVGGYLEEPYPEETTLSALRSCHAEWTVATRLESTHPLLQHFLLWKSATTAKGDWPAQFHRIDRESGLERETRQASAIIEALVAGKSPGPFLPAQSTLESRGLWAWEAEALTAEGSPPDWAGPLLKEHETMSETIFDLWVGSSVLWLGTLVVGLPFLPDALKCFRLSSHKPASPTTRVWRPSWVLSLVLMLIVFDDYIYSSVYLFLEAVMPGEANLKFLVSDSLWRLIPPVVLSLCCIAVWKHAPRVLGLDRPPALRPVLGMLAVYVLFDTTLFLAMDQFGLLRKEAFISSLEDGTFGLFYAIISGVVMAPLVEEVMFRGFLFQSLDRRRGFWTATLVSTVIFVLIHFYGIYGSLSVASFGILACVLYRATGSLWTPIAYHAAVNAVITANTWPVYNGIYSLP